MSRSPGSPAGAVAALLAGLAVAVAGVPPAAATTLVNRPCINGKAAQFSCKDVDLKAYVPIGDLGGGTASDVWGWADPGTGREYALMGTSRGLVIVDVTAPSAPVYLGTMPKPDPVLVWQDVEVYRNHAFVVCDLSPCGMQVLDLTRLRGAQGQRVWTPDHVYPLSPTTHTIDINGETGFAYLNGGLFPVGTPQILDITNPQAPVPLGFIADDGYTHDSHCRIYRGPDGRFTGKEICFNFNEDTITVYDLTNKLAPVRLARVSYPGASYIHSGWLTGDHRYLLSDDETDGKNIVFIWDVRLLDAPKLIGKYTGPTNAIDHNVYIKGGLAYLANYRAGLRILDTSGVASGELREIAYFDVVTGVDTATYDGAWSVYPFLPSGNVLISGMGQGLFVVDPIVDGPLPSATTVAIDGTSRDASTLTVSGEATFTDQPFLVHGSDPAGDAGLPAALGQDLVATSTATTVGGKVSFRWTVGQFPPKGDRAAPEINYGRSFCVVPAGSADPTACWEIDVWSNRSGPTTLDPSVEVWRCADPSCEPAEQEQTDIPGTAVFDAAGKQMTATVDAVSLEIEPGATLTPVDPGGVGSVWTAVADYYADGDATTIDTMYRAPVPEVSLAIGAPGLIPETVSYAAAATVAPEGRFSGSLDVGSLGAGTYAVYARACFGSNNCGYATASVTL